MPLSAFTVILEIESGNFADASGVPVSEGTLYGIVVNTDGSGFQPEIWMMDRPEPGTFLKRPDGSDSSDALVFVGFTSAAGPAPDEVPGWIGTTGEIPHADGDGLASTGDPWGIVWFPGLSSIEEVEPFKGYGFLSGEALTIPESNTVENFNVFIGNDIKTADYIVIPEPATYVKVFGVAVLGFVFLRRFLRGTPA